jgi:hypothetical protein
MAWTETIAMAESVEDLLYDHCLGAGDPSGYLLDHGQFPPGWVRRFDELLAVAKSRWGAETMLPRALAAALFYASFFPEYRYSAGRKISGRGGEEQTERDIAHLRSVSSLFLFQGARPHPAGSASSGP